ELRPRFQRRTDRVLDHGGDGEQSHDRLGIVGVEAVDIGLEGGFHLGLGRHHASPWMMSNAFSATMITGMLVLPPTRVGITEASTTRRPSTPWTLSLLSTTA